MGHSNWVRWSQSLSEDTHFLILLPPLKPENKRLVLYICLEVFSSFEANNVPCLPLTECLLV